jgi:thioredoxin 1
LVVRFAALYFVSLFAFDSYKAAEESPFNVRARR